MVEYNNYSFKAMGSPITIRAESFTEFDTVVKKIVETFKHIENLASRFKPESDISILNEQPSTPQKTNPILKELIKNSYQAYLNTEGKFDPRILKALENAGYVETFHNNTWEQIETKPYIIREKWEPEFTKNTVALGDNPIDLGGIGKSFAVEKSRNIIEQHSNNFFINAGGDIIFKKPDDSEETWTVGVENPYNIKAASPIVLKVHSTGIATSSKAKYNWKKDNKKWHHIIDPTTGMPSDSGITAVTVLHESVIQAEILSKTLMLHTHEEISRIVTQRNIKALWFTDDGNMSYNKNITPHINR